MFEPDLPQMEEHCDSKIRIAHTDHDEWFTVNEIAARLLVECDRKGLIEGRIDGDLEAMIDIVADLNRTMKMSSARFLNKHLVDNYDLPDWERRRFGNTDGNCISNNLEWLEDRLVVFGRWFRDEDNSDFIKRDLFLSNVWECYFKE